VTAGRARRSDRLASILDAVRQHRRRNSRLYRGGGWGLVALVGILIVGQVGLLVAGRLDALRLSGTAEVHIVAASVTGGSPYEQSPAGTHLRYTYMVDGTIYPGADFRRWVDIDAHRPKVCYDPSSPANHALVEGDYQCGSG
jgi:hypothetical protein